MSLEAELRELERAQESAMGALRSRVEALGGHEGGPAVWVGEHPYMAIAGASLAGFLAAPLAGPLWRWHGRKQRDAQKRDAERRGKGKRGPKSAEDADETGARIDRVLEILTLLASVAGQVMPSKAETCEPGVVVADAGVLQDPRDIPSFQDGCCAGGETR